MLIALFVAQEFRAEEPLLPPRLFRERIFTVCSAIGLIVGATMFGAIAFLPVYLQIVKGASATSSGLRLVPLMLGVVGTSVTSGLHDQPDTGRYRSLPDRRHGDHDVRAVAHVAADARRPACWRCRRTCSSSASASAW